MAHVRTDTYCIFWPGFCPRRCVVPAGTELVAVDPARGRWAVADEALVARLTGESKRAEGYYAYVPAEVVEQ